nr:E3 ubiquitin-protein ligase MARCH2-like isoform X1 [Ipomoea batatas]GME00543.1 E3 ubiquitin-protein ligase MARCH2-like isoform X1 [Ipomoea batatas]
MRGGGDAVGDGGAAAVTECGDRISGAEKPCLEAGDQSLLAIVVSAGDSVDCEEKGCVESPQKGHLSRNSSSQEQCRVCQQEKEEDLIELGCHCRGGLAKAHRTCIDTWFNTRGSNKCEICQQVAANVAMPESNAPASYWVWRVDPSFRGATIAPERNRGCFSPLWVAFSILIGGLLLDLLISLTLGVSALPVNIIIGVIVVLGLGTAFRLALEFCHDWSVRRVVHRVEANVSLGFHPAL